MTEQPAPATNPGLEAERPARPWLLALGIPIGFVSSLCGIGGGLFAGSLLHFAFGFDLRRSAGTALVLVLATTAAATATELTRPEPAIELATWAALVLGVWFGAALGFRFSEAVSERVLRSVFAVVMLFSALRLVTGGGGAPVLDGVPAEGIDWLAAALTAGVGLIGGFCAPVLGVGGGLILVPGLFLLVPEQGFDGARATSLAAGVVGAVRSLRLKARAERVAWRHGTYLALGALVGAALGVRSLEALIELVEVGRWTLALLLTFLGLRFARAALRG